MPYPYQTDFSTLLIILPSLLFAMIAQWKVQSAFKKYSQIHTRRGTTGSQAAEAILRQNGLTEVRVEGIAGQLTDHFDPRAKVIRLSEPVIGTPSVAAVGIAAHEAGHAVQHAVGYFPIKVRQAIIPVTNIGSKLSMPLIIIGLVLPSFAWLLNIGIALFSLVFVFQLVTLPVEFNASRRALQSLEGSHTLDAEELQGARKVLSAAALTYVAALAVTLSQIARLLMMSGGRRGNNR